MSKVGVRTEAQLAEFYGKFAKQAANVEFDPKPVPAGLRCLIPYAKFWGVSDDDRREKIAKKAPAAVRKYLVELIQQFDKKFDAWFGKASVDQTSTAYIAFSALRMCADSIHAEDSPPISEELRRQRTAEILKAIRNCR